MLRDPQPRCACCGSIRCGSVPGSFRSLTLPSPRAIRPRGVLLFSYAKLKLQLAIEGFDARFHAYDWRLGIDALGAALAAAIAAAGEPAVVVAHSMGGLVARVAARPIAAPGA